MHLKVHKYTFLRCFKKMLSDLQPTFYNQFLQQLMHDT